MNFESSLEKEIRGSASNSSGSEGKGKRVGCSVGGSMVMNVEDRSEVVTWTFRYERLVCFGREMEDNLCQDHRNVPRPHPLFGNKLSAALGSREIGAGRATRAIFGYSLVIQG